MRKLRRLPWRIPKTHHAQQHAAAAAPVQAAPREHMPSVDLERELQRERERERLDTQPVAFAGGRYVAPVPHSTEIRRKTRHRVMLLPAVAVG